MQYSPVWATRAVSALMKAIAVTDRWFYGTGYPSTRVLTSLIYTDSLLE